MAYERIAGTIEQIGRTRKQIQLDDGEWYGAFDKSQLGDAEVGDSVEFDMQANDKGDKVFLNIKGDVQIIGEDGEPIKQAPRGRGNARDSGRAAPARSSGRAPARDAAPQRGESRGAGARGARTSAAGGGGADPRQVSIVRQSSVTAALRVIELHDGFKADIQELSVEDAAQFVIELARQFEAYGTSTD